MTISREKITELRAMVAKMCPGPWGNSGPTFDTVEGKRMYGCIYFDEISMQEARDTCAAIAAIRNSIVDLLDIAERSLDIK